MGTHILEKLPASIPITMKMDNAGVHESLTYQIA
jgi:hypothetical protein